MEEESSNPNSQLYLNNDPDHFISQLERKAQAEGLQYIDKLVLENGAVYKGYLREGIKHGPGIYIKPNGAKYEGEWK